MSISKFFLLALYVINSSVMYSQEIDSLKSVDPDKAEVFNKLTKDTTNKIISRAQILLLKKGAIVVRLKTNERSIEQYRKAGKNELADKIESENLNRNNLIVSAFKSRFAFCKVYFIYAKNTKEFLAGNSKLFLNDSLQVDSTIQPKEKFVLLSEYGTVMSNVINDNYHYKELKKTSESNQPLSTSAFFLSDLSLTQLKEPFPFYTVVYLDKYYKAAERWSNALEKYYMKVLIKKDNFISEYSERLMANPDFIMPVPNNYRNFTPPPAPNFFK